MVERIRHRVEEISNKRNTADFARIHDRNRSLNNDVLRPEINKNLSDSAQKTLKNLLKIPDDDQRQILTDGKGTFGVQLKDHNGEFGEGFVHTIDIRTFDPEVQKNLVYEAEKHIVQQHAEKYARAQHQEVIPPEDLNQLKKIGGQYYFTKRDGTTDVLPLDEDTKKNINNDLSDIGIRGSHPVENSMVKDVIGYAVEEAKKKELDASKHQNLENSLKSGMVYDFNYDKNNKKYEFYILPKDGIKDGKMVYVSFDQKNLPSTTRINLTYQEKKYAFAETFRLNVNEMHNFQELNGKYHYRGDDQEWYVLEPTPEQIRNIDKYLSDRGLHDVKRQISPDSIGKAVLEHKFKLDNPAITDKDTIRAGVEDEMKYTTVYDYHFDEKEKKTSPHVFHIMKTEQVNEKWIDTPMEISLTEAQFKEIFKNAELYAAEKYIKLPDSKTIKPGGVEFDPNDEIKYLVTAADEDTHTVPKADVAAEVKNELDMKPAVKLDDVLPEKQKQTHVDLGGEDSELDKLEKAKKRFENITKQLKRFLRVLSIANDAALVESSRIGQLVDKMLQTGGDAQQPIPSATTQASYDAIKKIISKHIEIMEKEINILKEHAPIGSFDAKNMQHLLDLMHGKKEIDKNSKNITDYERNAALVGTLRQAGILED